MEQQSYPFRKPVKSYLLNRRYLNFCVRANMRSYWLACSEVKERCKRKSVSVFKTHLTWPIAFFILFLYLYFFFIPSNPSRSWSCYIRIWMVRYSVNECWMLVKWNICTLHGVIVERNTDLRGFSVEYFFLQTCTIKPFYIVKSTFGKMLIVFLLFG